MSSQDINSEYRAASLDRTKVEAEQRCPACQQVLWTTFCFDGFGFSDKYGVASNIAKIHAALIEDTAKGARAFYYPGLGAEYDPETEALTEALGGKAEKELKDKVASTPKDTAKGAVMDVWKESERLSDKSYASRAAWTANQLAERAKKQGRKIARTIQKPVTTVAKEGWKTLRKEWRALWRDVVKHPWRAAKEAGAAVAKNTAGYAAESVGLIRDSALSAALFNTGVDTRLKSAETDFKAAFALAKRKLPVHRINVAIFGYDMGGGIALAFSKMLIDDICRGGNYEGVEVKIRFMGLFDCVANRYDDNLLTGFIPLSNKVSSEMKLLKEVERCVHYAAAHELRFYKPLTIIGGNQTGTGSRQEILFPGSQVDVGGGAGAEDTGVLDGLARYPLQLMYNKAYGAGIPMSSFQNMKADSPDLYARFEISEEVKIFQRNYRNAVTSLVESTQEITPEIIRLNLPYVCSYAPPDRRTTDQQTQCFVPPEPIVVKTLPKDIQGQMKGHMIIYIQWLRMWYEQFGTTATEQTGSWLTSAPKYPAAKGRYDKLASELRYLERNARSVDTFTMEQAKKQLDGEVAPNIFVSDPQGQALYWIWNNPGKRQPEVESLYPGFLKYMHDSMAESALEGAYGSLVLAKHYMNSRPMQKIETKPDKSFLKDLWDSYLNLYK
ncbi:phospholipase effector Tle1 domain-containing protein [Xanthomonas maliensis]|uniref:phospholipase effector Tle1 domain-containing protein n=1 Tax=Xanthomonas maliensis TaxID=1321368 RepID=UPI001264C57E|nr:DUF2235 domain-containing protein [Xanthomonas maliensis]KAB7769375.1 hypothetical protein CKY51_07260 [Xanthomonas maliensis]